MSVFSGLCILKEAAAKCVTMGPCVSLLRASVHLHLGDAMCLCPDVYYVHVLLHYMSVWPWHRAGLL